MVQKAFITKGSSNQRWLVQTILLWVTMRIPMYVFSKAAALLDVIARNHGFRDGNKRTAMAAAVLYLTQNDIEIVFTNQEYEEIMLHVVNDKPTIEEIKQWLEVHAANRS